MFSSLKRTEVLMLMMVAISAVAIVLYIATEREVTISPNTQWYTETVDDAGEGGNSKSSATSNNGRFTLDYDIQEGTDNPYAIMLMHPPESGTLLDFSWYETVTLRAYVEGKGDEYFRLQLRNRNESVYDPTDRVSVKYNTVLFQLTSEPQTQTFSKDNFYVPEWWVERMSVSLDEAMPRFDHIEWVELATGTKPSLGPGRVVIEEIKFSGHWVSTSFFYGGMMAMWMTAALMYLLCPCVGLRKRLKQSETMELSLQRQTAELVQLATLDPLTQLYNRRGMRSHVSEALQDLKQSEQVFSLIMFDIDNFKKLNDEHGHVRGDEVLRQVASVALDTLTEHDPIARWGGEEFLVLCKKRDARRAGGIAHELRTRFESELDVTCSFGVCEILSHVEFPVALDTVDHYLYMAKSSGKNCVKVMFGQPKLPVAPLNRPAIKG